MAQPATIKKLWDFGWIRRDVVVLLAATSAGDLIEQYCSDSSFHLSFLSSEKDETGLHGPFVADRIAPSDFVPLSVSDIPEYMDNIEVAHDPADDVEARAIILKELEEVLKNRSSCFALRFTEKSSEQFHGWGFVFSVFREILVPDLDKQCLDRFVIGYD